MPARTFASLRSLAALSLFGAALLAPASAKAAPGCSLPPAGAEVGSEALAPPYVASYQVWRLPAMTGGPTNTYLGGMAIDSTNPNLFYVIDHSEYSSANLFQVTVTRDACGHVSGWAGDALLVAHVPYGDAGLLHGPKGSLVYSDYVSNRIWQLPAWSSASPPTAALYADMSARGVTPGTIAGLAWVPAGYSNAGALMGLVYNGYGFFSIPFTADSSTGEMTFSNVSLEATLPTSGHGGIVYVPAGSPVLASRGLLTENYRTGQIEYYPTSATGVPDPAQMTPFLTGAGGPWGGGFQDPISGDVYWTAWSGDDRVHVISGFTLLECATDADCHVTEYCNAATTHCVSKVASGAAMPSDPSHAGTALDGTCTAAQALVACASGACNATTNTCGGGGGAACSAAEQCASNTCTSAHCVPNANGCYVDADCAAGTYCSRASLLCAEPLVPGSPIPSDGLHDGVCDAAEAQIVCATGLCNAAKNTCAKANGATCSSANECVSNACTSGHCVPSPNGCYADDDCTVGRYCDRATLTCAPQLPAGSAIPSDGLHDGACSPTEAQAVCATGSCNATQNTCASAAGVACSNRDQCVSNTCASGHCVPSSSGCYVDADCAAGTYCSRSTLLCAAVLRAGAAIPSDGLHDGTCAAATVVCASGACDAAQNTCASPPPATCTSANQCTSNTCASGHCVPAPNGCYLDSDCASGFCGAATLTCTAKLARGARLPSDRLHDGQCAPALATTVCASGLCNAQTNTCAEGVGVACTAAPECVSNACADGHCGGTGGSCYVDPDCPAGQFCHRAHLACVAKLAPGAALPNDGLHDGRCTPELAALTCQIAHGRAQCDPVAATCATSTGEACSASNQCVTNACASGRCVPSPNGCYLDSDCTAGTYCDRSALACAAKLPLGGALPRDGLHDGTCTAATATAICATAACNSASATCALPDGRACTANGQCATNRCGAGVCGGTEPVTRDLDAGPSGSDAVFVQGGGLTCAASPPGPAPLEPPVGVGLAVIALAARRVRRRGGRA
jgi:hypothetical protein